MAHTLIGQLVFSAETSAQLVNVSSDLSDISSSKFTLGAHTPPHITLFKRAIESEAALHLSVEKIEAAVSFLGACQLGDDEGMVWAAIEIHKSPSLLKLRHKVMRYFDVEDGKANFYPHVSVAHIPQNAFSAAAQKINAHPVAQKAGVVCLFDLVLFSSETGYRRYRDGTFV